MTLHDPFAGGSWPRRRGKTRRRELLWSAVFLLLLLLSGLFRLLF